MIELASHFAYLWILWVFVNRIVDFEPVRHAFVMAYPLANLLNPQSLSTLPSLLVLLSLLSWFPHAPSYHSFGLSCVLFSLYAELIFLHFPSRNSPLHLFRPEQVLPLAVLAWRGLYALLIPTVFFIPGLVISFTLFVQTFQHWGLWTLASRFANDLGGPTDTQVAFFYLLFTIFLFTFTSLIYAVVVNPFLAASRGPESSSWDRYTRPVGLDARRAFIRAVQVYGTGHYMPAPLNLVQVLFVHVPRFALNVFGKQGAAKKLEGVDRAVWRIMVAPAAFVVSGFWLWHLRNF